MRPPRALPRAAGNERMMPEQAIESSFLSGPNAAFIVELYARYARDPQSVEPEVRAYFATLGDEAAEALADLRGASWAPRQPEILTNGADMLTNGAPASAKTGNGAAPAPAVAPTQLSFETLRATATDSIRALQLIRSYRVRG